MEFNQFKEAMFSDNKKVVREIVVTYALDMQSVAGDGYGLSKEILTIN